MSVHTFSAAAIISRSPSSASASQSGDALAWATALGSSFHPERKLPYSSGWAMRKTTVPRHRGHRVPHRVSGHTTRSVHLFPEPLRDRRALDLAGFCIP